MRIISLLAASISLAALSSPALGQNAAGISFSTGIDYSSGDYGAAQNTDILVIPFSLKAQTGNFSFTASVPYLRIEGPGDVVLGPGGQPLPGVPTAGGVRKGLGDLSLGANYTVSPEADGLGFDLGARVKLPTSEKKRQLSTGETDVTVTGELSYTSGNFIPFVQAGYRFLGDPAGVDLRNGPTLSAGTSVIFGSTVFITSYDYARASSRLAEDSHEVFAGLSAPVSDRLNLTGYGIAGLSKGSPDFGVGLLLTVDIF